MAQINPIGADVRLLSYSGYPKGTCLVQCAKALLQGKPSLVGHTTASALQAWNEAPGNVPNALPTVNGTPGFWSGAGGFGDVSLWHDGAWAAVDTRNGVFKAGVSGIQTTAQRSKQLGGKYLGYSTTFLGYKLVSGGFAGVGPVTPIPSIPTAPAVPTVQPIEDYMSYSIVADASSATMYVVSLVSGNRAAIASPYHVQLLQRAKINNGADRMLVAELDIVHQYIAAINPPAAVASTALTAAQINSIAAAVSSSIKIPPYPTRGTVELS